VSALTTWSGHHFDPLHPDPDLICIEDIAHALSNICRYGGHADSFYSVAQHSHLMSTFCTPRLRRACLLHDAAEAYIGDMVRPIKHGTLLGSIFEDAENKLLRMIFEKFGVPINHLPAVEFWDRFMLRWEQRDLRPRCLEADGYWFTEAEGGVSPERWLRPWTPVFSKELFLEQFHVLFDRQAVAA